MAKTRKTRKTMPDVDLNLTWDDANFLLAIIRCVILNSEISDPQKQTWQRIEKLLQSSMEQSVSQIN